MIDQQPDAQTPVQQGRTIPIQERSVRVGDVIVVNGYRAKRSSLTARFAVGGYQVHETRPFLLFTRAEEPETILVHWFAPEEMTTNIPGHLAEELQPFGLVNSSQRLGEVFAGIVGERCSPVMYNAPGITSAPIPYSASWPSSARPPRSAFPSMASVLPRLSSINAS